MTTAMEPTKEEWVAALRSGKYEQGSRQLRSSSDRFCCLGVLCDIDPRVKWVKPDPAFGLGRTFAEGPDGGKNMSYPPVPYTWMDDDFVNTCSDWNDTYGLDFAQIADRIESGLWADDPWADDPWADETGEEWS